MAPGQGQVSGGGPMIPDRGLVSGGGPWSPVTGPGQVHGLGEVPGQGQQPAGMCPVVVNEQAGVICEIHKTKKHHQLNYMQNLPDPRIGYPLRQ